MVGKIPRKIRDKSSFANYLKKAEQFLRTMKDSIEYESYDSAALNGIHAVISAIDAMLVFRYGIVSASQNHEDAIRLLIELIPETETKIKSKHALAVIKQKTTVEYWDTLTTASEAREIAKHTERFFEWIKSKLPEIK